MISRTGDTISVHADGLDEEGAYALARRLRDYVNEIRMVALQREAAERLRQRIDALRAKHPDGWALMDVYGRLQWAWIGSDGVQTSTDGVYDVSAALAAFPTDRELRVRVSGGRVAHVLRHGAHYARCGMSLLGRFSVAAADLPLCAACARKISSPSPSALSPASAEGGGLSSGGGGE